MQHRLARISWIVLALVVFVALAWRHLVPSTIHIAPAVSIPAPPALSVRRTLPLAVAAPRSEADTERTIEEGLKLNEAAPRSAEAATCLAEEKRSESIDRLLDLVEQVPPESQQTLFTHMFELLALPETEARCGWAEDAEVEVNEALCRALAARPDDASSALAEQYGSRCP